MTAPRAQHGRTRRQRRVGLPRLRFGHVAEKFVPQVLQAVGVEFEHVEFRLVLDDLQPECLYLILKERIEFLDDEQTVNRLREVLDQCLRERIRPAEFQDRVFREDFAHVLEGDRRGDDAEFLLAGDDAVQLRLTRGLLHRKRPLLRGKAVSAREHWHGNRLADVLHVGDEFVRLRVEVPEIHK